MLYDVGDGVRRLVETRRTFDDGAYHRVWFERRGSDATLRVDSYPAHTLTFHGRSRYNDNDNEIIITVFITEW